MRKHIARSLARAVYITWSRSGNRGGPPRGELIRIAADRGYITTAVSDSLARGCLSWNKSSSGSQHFLHTAVAALAPSSSESESISDTSDEDERSYLLAEEGDSDEESEQWKQFRDVGDGSDDDDADHVNAQIPNDRYVLPGDVRRKGAAALNADDSDKPGMDESLLKVEEPLHDSVPLKDLYEARLDEYAQKMSDLHSDTHTGSGRKMTRKERLARLAEATAREDMQVEGLPEVASNVIEPGIQQLAALTESGEWNMVVVDVKMTTKQTPQGKKSRFSAMVMVGNLNGKGAYGIGVAKEVNDAIFKAIRFAVLGAINIPLYRGHTIYYPSKTKFIRTKISIFPRPSDFGISASPIIMQACELLGIRDITVKTHNSRNTRNVVKGFFQALANTPTAAEVAEAKGVYLRERVSRKLFHKEHLLG